MDIRSWLQEVAILIVVYEIAAMESDVLESFRPKEDNPPELNEFLNNVLERKNDFDYVRQTARKYQKMKKEITDTNLFNPLDSSSDEASDFYNTFTDTYKIQDKRHIHHGNQANRRFRNLGLLPPNLQRGKFRRTRRRAIRSSAEPLLLLSKDNKDIKKRFPQIIMLQEEDGTVKKRMPSPVVMLEQSEPEEKNHLPTQIFLEPEGERIEKRVASNIVIEPEGEKGKVTVNSKSEGSPKIKKQIDFSSAVHRTYKAHPSKQNQNNMNSNKQGDFYYVDLENAAEKDMGRYEDSRRYEWYPHRRDYYYPEHRMMYHHPPMGRRPENADYPHYDTGLHHSLSDEIAFEKALSYEIDPRYPENPEGFNNPAGNSLLSVDQGRPDYVRPLYAQDAYGEKPQGMARYEYPPQDPFAVTNEKFYIDNDSSMRRIDTTTEGSSTTTSSTSSMKPGDDKDKNLKRVGNGFIEISKSRRDNDESPFIKSSLVSPITDNAFDTEDKQAEEVRQDKDDEESSILSKNSLHPLRVKDTSHEENDELQKQNEERIQDLDKSRLLEERETNDVNKEVEQFGDIDELNSEKREKRDLEKKDHLQTRKLQFIDYENTDFYSHDENYGDVPVRARRDFLDALGMKNEEDYSEDNPYVKELTVNNTCVHNDTHICNGTTHRPVTTPRNKASSTCHQKEEIKNIKQILEEPKDIIPDITTSASVKKKKYHKRQRKRSFEEDPIDIINNNSEMRIARGTDMETKILQNKQKIYNSHEDSNNHNSNANHGQIRQERTMPQWSEEIQTLNNEARAVLNLPHKINKKEDYSFTVTVEVMEPTTSAPSNCTENNNSNTNNNNNKAINSTYVQVAHQMDVENEKLAQVVNGHLASNIVSRVFCELKKKNSLKTKFYSGLSRKHVNFAGTIDFDIFKTNETEDVDEARLLLEQITKVLNRLVINQVRRKLCQRLPDELRDYLETVLNVKNTIETANFVPNTNQGNFLFTYQDKNEPPFDLQKLQAILIKLEGLLLSYHNMNDDCQSRAGPVADYIAKHVKMLKQIVSCPSHNCEDKLSETKRETMTFNKNLVEKQLESVGLGKNQEFIPNFDLNQLVQNKMRSSSWKTDKKRDVPNSDSYKSAQFQKLQIAAQNVRQKRENERKIAELFGSKQKRSVKKFDVDYEEPVVYSLG